MTHIESNIITQATDSEIQHLESCERCRRRIVTDVDLGSVRDQLLSEATTEPRSVTPPQRRSLRPWLVGVGAAALVLALFVPVLLLDNQPPDDSAATSPNEPGTTTPALPSTLSEERPNPATPPVGSETSSFEMTFEGSDGVIGRLIWASPTFYEGLRVSVNQERATYDYGFFRDGDYGYDAEMFDPFPKTEDGHIEVGALPEDPVVPWAILLDRLSLDDMWTAIGGTGQPSPVEPSHPLADSAYAGERFRLELSEDRIPVVVQSPSAGIWQVTSLVHRPVRAGEVGNNIDFPFEYALYLADSTSDEQRVIIGDGMVSFGDYQDATTETAECAGVEATFDDNTGLFAFDSSPQLDDCRAQHMDDIEEVWRVDSQFIGEDEFSILWHKTQGQPELAAMYEATPGPELALASGPGWAISVWERGEGICSRASVGSSVGEGCNLPSMWPVPQVLDVSVGIIYNGENQPMSGEITGLVAANATRLEVTFASGDTIDIEPGDTIQLGFKGFGLPRFDSARLGEPTTIEVFAGEISLGVYDHSVGRSTS